MEKFLGIFGFCAILSYLDTRFFHTDFLNFLAFFVLLFYIGNFFISQLFKGLGRNTKRIVVAISVLLTMFFAVAGTSDPKKRSNESSEPTTTATAVSKSNESSESTTAVSKSNDSSESTTAVSKSSEPSQASAEKFGYIKGTDVSIRKGPSTKTDRLGFVNTNDKVKLLGVENGDGKLWYRIIFNGTEGYVFGEYVSEQEVGSVSNPNEQFVYKRADGVEYYILKDSYQKQGEEEFLIKVKTYYKGENLDVTTYLFNSRHGNYGKYIGNGKFEDLRRIENTDFSLSVWKAARSNNS